MTDKQTSGRTGPFADNSKQSNRHPNIPNPNPSHLNHDTNVIITPEMQPLKPSKMNQGQSPPTRTNIRSKYQVGGTMHVRMESPQLFKLVFLGFAILLGLGFLFCLRLNALENQISSLQLENQLVVKQLRQLSADCGNSELEYHDSEEKMFSSSPTEGSGEGSLEIDDASELVHVRKRRSIPSQLQSVPSTSNVSAIANSSIEESAEFINSTFTNSNSSRILRHLKPGAGVGRRGRDRERDIRAAYLRPAGAHVSIEKAEQYIGPWHLAYDAKSIGFNDLWYDRLSLDENGTSIVFEENGLYAISSQVYYHNALQKERTMPMGYRIYVKKAPPTKFQRPIQVAECVTSYPSTYFQTCFTAVTWFLEKGDEIFLKHFKNSLPIIEADEQGKTFVQIVKLGG